MPETLHPILQALKEILGSGYGTVAVVGHRDANAILIGEILGLTLEESLNIDQPNNCIYFIDTETKYVEYRWEGKTRKGLKIRQRWII